MKRYITDRNSMRCAVNYSILFSRMCLEQGLCSQRGFTQNPAVINETHSAATTVLLAYAFLILNSLEFDYGFLSHAYCTIDTGLPATRAVQARQQS